MEVTRMIDTGYSSVLDLELEDGHVTTLLLPYEGMTLRMRCSARHTLRVPTIKEPSKLAALRSQRSKGSP